MLTNILLAVNKIISHEWWPHGMVYSNIYMFLHIIIIYNTLLSSFSLSLAHPPLLSMLLSCALSDDMDTLQYNVMQITLIVTINNSDNNNNNETYA